MPVYSATLSKIKNKYLITGHNKLLIDFGLQQLETKHILT